MTLTSSLTSPIKTRWHNVPTKQTKPCVKAWMNPNPLKTLTQTSSHSDHTTQYEINEHQRSSVGTYHHTDVITHIIAFISILIWPPRSSNNSSSATPVQAQQDIGSTSTTGSQPLMVKSLKQSSSTTSVKSTEAPKKEAGGTSQARRTKRTASSRRSNASTASSTSPKTWSYTNNHPLMTAEVLPPFMPRLEKDSPNTIPPSGLVIARYDYD